MVTLLRTGAAERTGTDGPAVAPDGQAAFEAAYREHRGAVVRLLQRRVGNPDEAEELAQEAYLRALRYRDHNPESLKALLFRIAINLAGTNARRDRAHHASAHTSVDDLPLATDEMPQDERLAREEYQALIIAAIKEMPEKRRQVFVLSRFHGMRQKDIAKRCGISLSMVEKHITNGLSFIRERVGEVPDERFTEES